MNGLGIIVTILGCWLYNSVEYNKRQQQQQASSSSSTNKDDQWMQLCVRCLFVLIFAFHHVQHTCRLKCCCTGLYYYYYFWEFKFVFMTQWKIIVWNIWNYSGWNISQRFDNSLKIISISCLNKKFLIFLFFRFSFSYLCPNAQWFLKFFICIIILIVIAINQRHFQRCSTPAHQQDEKKTKFKMFFFFKYMRTIARHTTSIQRVQHRHQVSLRQFSSPQHVPCTNDNDE